MVSLRKSEALIRGTASAVCAASFQPLRDTLIPTAACCRRGSPGCALCTVRHEFRTVTGHEIPALRRADAGVVPDGLGVPDDRGAGGPEGAAEIPGGSEFAHSSLRVDAEVCACSPC